MLGLSSKTILLCTLCTMAKALTFDWFEFNPVMGDKETIIDFSGNKIKLLSADGMQVHYLYGPLKIKKDFDESYKVHYMLRHKNKETGTLEAIPGIPDGIANSCDFYDRFYKKYMQPKSSNHNDFPPNVFCPVKAGTYTILQVDNLKPLNAPSDLSPGEYKVQVIYRMLGKIVGGYRGHFIAENLH